MSEIEKVMARTLKGDWIETSSFEALKEGHFLEIVFVERISKKELEEYFPHLLTSK